MLRRSWLFVIGHWPLIIVILLGLTATRVTHWLAVDLPSPDRLYEHASAPSTRIYDRHGRLLYEILDPHGGAHTPIPLAEVPPACVNSTIATEDASFYNNPGVDTWAIARALWINLRGGGIRSGGSTITQQLARNLLLSSEERAEISLERKLREAILAWRLARTYSKDEILTLYLNETYYGNLAYGIEAAARTYFAKSAAELDLAECALLAGLPQSPARYNPLENPQAAQARQSVVLGLMVKHGYISQQEANLADSEKLGFAAVPFPIEAPHFVMYVRGQLEKEFGLEAIYTQGLQVYTTLDLDAQNAAQRSVHYRLEQLADIREGQPSHNAHNAAVVVMDPHTGKVLAMVGSPNYFDPRIDGAVNGAVAARQPGSSIKPITYAAAFDPRLGISDPKNQKLNPLTAATMMVDARTAYVTREGDPYVPQNYDYQWRGPVLLREALASSYNLIAVKVLDYVGIEDMTALARSLGITTFDDVDRFGLALTLGGGEVRLLELTAAYGAFANGGHRVEPVTIIRVEDSHGQVLKGWEAAPGPRVMDERVAYLITDILSDNLARAPTFGEGSALRLSRPAAAKTGTTTDWRDNWTVGYTPDLVTGVWVGNADNEPMRHVSGVVGAAPIWHDVMETLLRGRPVREFVEPEGMVRMEVCVDSGLPPVQVSEMRDWRLGQRITQCPRTITELFIEGTEPTRSDDWHWLFTLDTRNGLLAGPDCPPQFTTQKRYTIYPAEAREWARSQNIPQPPEAYSPLSPGVQIAYGRPQTANKPTHSSPPAPYSLILTSPDQGSHYRLSPEIPSSAQQILVTARPVDGVSLRQVTLLADGRPLVVLTSPPYQVLWPMTSGAHTFTTVGVDAHGEEIRGNRVIIQVTE
ncbi:MAG: PBP1A family penicillin-binding protein [Chloroflexota bacterium]|nr:PBP1A family penicillin-binding protein [Chloroflexota bacterium]